MVHHFIKTLDNVEGINADPGVWKVLPGDRDKAVAHVAAEVFYPLPLLWRELMEILVQIDTGDLIQDVDDRVGVTVRDATVIFIAIPPMRLGAPHTAVAFEFVNTDGFREFGWPAKVDGLKDRLDGALGDMVSPGNLGEGERLYKVQEDGVIESLCHAKRGMDPVGSLVERGVAVLAQEPAFVEGDDGTAMITGDMPDGLYGPGVFDDTVVRATMGT